MRTCTWGSLQRTASQGWGCHCSLKQALGKRAASSDKLLGKQASWATLTNAILLKIHGQALGLVFWVIGAFPVLEILAAPASMLLFPLREGKQAFPEDSTLGPS